MGERHLRPISARAKMMAVSDAHDADPRGLRLGNRFLHGESTDDLPQSAIAIDHSHGRRILDNPDVGAWIVSPHPQALGVPNQSRAAVRMDAAEIGFDKAVHRYFRIRLRYSDLF